MVNLEGGGIKVSEFKYPENPEECEEVEQEIKYYKIKSLFNKSEGGSTGSSQFTYISCPDKKGIVYWLGTN